ncbi:hypothetical protein HGRIS_009155 [Hohenbuehelia grisea]|uniref:Uncharacterized protein n=1 Tax=Hohenbuehelia grisea TaxID=104357 RepID=A0ABR3J0K8_9AGAR
MGYQAALRGLIPLSCRQIFPSYSPLFLARNCLPVRSAHQTARGNVTPKNKNIPYEIVQLKDPVTNSLRPPQPLKEVLAQIDQKNQFVELVIANPNPIVRIVQKADAYASKRQHKDKLRDAARRNVHKEVQLTWGAAMADLSHKLRKARTDLEKGYRVDLVFASKSGHPLPTPAEMHARAEETVELLADVSTEWRPRDIKRTAMAMFFQGRRVGEKDPAAPSSTDPASS